MSGSGKTNLPLLVAVLSLLVFILVYLNIFQPKQESIERLRQMNEELAEELADLQLKTDNQQYFADQTVKLENTIQEIYGFFPADVQIEDAIVTALELEDTAPAMISSIGFVPSAEVYTVGDGEVKDLSEQTEAAQENAAGDGTDTTLEEDVMTAQEGGATTYSEGAEIHVDAIQLPGGYEGEFGPITLKDAVTTMNFQTSYEGMKNLVDYFARSENRTTIAQISLAYDSGTGLLNGSTTINRYSLTGTGKEYTPPSFPVDAIGTSNIFGTIELQNGGFSNGFNGSGFGLPQDEITEYGEDGMPLEEAPDSTSSTQQDDVGQNETVTRETSQGDDREKTYILNTSTLVFHNPGCSRERAMNDENREEVFLSRKEVMARGYEPCRVCDP